MTYLVAFLKQLIFFMGFSTYLIIQQRFKGDKRPLKEMIDESVQSFGSLLFFVLLFFWLTAGTWYRYYTNLPLLGIWGYLL